MCLEDPVLLKEKNRKRLRDVYNIAFALGINVTAPSKFKDSLRIITVILLINSCITIYAHLAYIIRHKHNLIMQAESMSTLFQALISTFKLTYLLFGQRQFYIILNKIQTHELVERIEFLANETPYNKELRLEVVKILDNCWRIAKGQFNFYIFSVCTIISYYFLAAVCKNAYNAHIGTPNYTVQMPYPMLLQFMESKLHKFPFYELALFISGLGGYLTGICAICFDGIFIIIAIHGVALYRILDRIIVFTTTPNIPKELRVDYLRQCIYHHERTYQYCTHLNSLYEHLSLAQFMMSLVIFGGILFQAALGLETDIMIFLRMMLYLSAAGFEVLLYCLNGQFLTTESETIQFSWYNCEWYNESREFKQLIKMMIMRSSRPMDMSVSRFSTMSMPTFMAIVKTSWSFFLLLRNVAFE